MEMARKITQRLIGVGLALLLVLSAGMGEAWGVEKIFFTSDIANPGGTTLHIWMMNPDGSGLEQVTSGNVLDISLELSRDGTKLVFSRGTPGAHDCLSVWVRDLITGVETQVTTDDFPATSFSSSEPTWSPDGTKIAFSRAVLPGGGSCTSGHIPGSSRIWIVDYLPSIGTPVQLSPVSGASRLWPSWSPDGTNILYGHEVGGVNPLTVFKITLATGIEEQVIPHVGGEYLPRYSPDGTKFTWTTFRHSQEGDIYIADVANPTGSQTRVTPFSGFDNSGWSPDGSRLVFRSTSSNIWVINIDGTGLTQLTFGPGTDHTPWWGDVRLEIQVSIDIKPGSDPNSINLKSKGTVAVAILGTPEFNVDDVAVNTVEFAGASPVRFSFEDVNLDGHVDLIFHFLTQDLELTFSDTEVTLTGETLGGIPFTGTDSVRIVK